MTGLTVDTSALIDLLAGEPATLRALDSLEREGHTPVLSTVTVFEALSGVELTRSRTERARLEALLRTIPIESFTLEDARKASEARAELSRAGRSPGAPDVMIVGFALSRGHALVTRDRRLAEGARALGAAVVRY